MFDKILIANRGEIALRIHRACREMGIKTVAVHSSADAAAMHVRLADESVCIGPPTAKDSYLNIPAIISAAEVTNADAIHPGYGFLAENPGFADIVEEHGFVFIGPHPNHIRMMGDKLAAKSAVKAAGLPVVAGCDQAVVNANEARRLAESIGYPVLLKPAAGGGGTGMKVVREPGAMNDALVAARTEAKASFGNGDVFMEKFLRSARHIEIQVLADGQGNVVHLGERDCSLQRRHQKLVEETPSPAVNAADRDALGETVATAVRRLGYRGVGTVEFLYADGAFYFIEMNTRLQVEHPVTEMVTGIDLVREQILVAAGRRLDLEQGDIAFQGHAIECRVNAEHPVTFAPSPGEVTTYHAPGGLGVRVDSALYSGYRVPPYYDSLVAKVVVHGTTRNECLMRLRRALEECVIDGIATTIPLHLQLISSNEFVDGAYDINWLEKFIAG